MRFSKEGWQVSYTRVESRSNVLEVLESVEALRHWREQTLGNPPQEGKRRAQLGLVPTMGYLHAGHLSLVERAKEECDFVAVSIFVNPLQFGPNEDFAKYPRDLEGDLSLLGSAGVDCVFSPSTEEVYGDLKKATTQVVPPQWLIDKLCGSFRPGHFEGVATIVNKLFNMVQPDIAYFGEKDYQQLLVIRQMVKDLNMNLNIQGVPIVREPDGLAMSSRNVYLSQNGRKKAVTIHEVLTSVKNAIEEKRSVSAALEEGRTKLESTGFEVQYLEACDIDTLEPASQPKKPIVLLCAAKLDNVRLIDNMIVQ
ncbi:MAG: pantoate--beta-alanine ligase [Candidatus Melainabacteria bacterium]|nr:pantoate--beta-alanine ligase [Candidatus Melainabacteria bacterium]